MCRHKFKKILHDVIKTTDPSRAVFLYMEKCSKCEEVKRRWSQQVRGFSTNGEGWTVPQYTDFIRDLLNLRP